MIRRVALILGMFFIAAPITCSELTKAFSTTKSCTGFFIGNMPFLTVLMLRKVADHTLIPPLLAGSVISAIVFEGIGMLSRLKNSSDQNAKRYGESFIGGFLTSFIGTPLTYFLVKHI